MNNNALSFFDEIVGLLGGPIAAIGRWYRREQVRDRLTRMSDRQLADIGLTRGDIPAIVAGTYRREPEVVMPPIVFALVSESRHAAVNDDAQRLAA